MYKNKKISKLQRWGSYIWGGKNLKFHSPINGELNIYFIKGRYILNAQNTNYSYGELHIGFQKIFNHLGFKTKKFKHVLLLGFGVGSVVSILQEELKINCHITAIEKDPIIIELGEKYFETQRFKNLKIVEADALDFVKNCTEKFDLIVFDIYINNEIPSIFESKEFLIQLKKLMSENSILVFNKDINASKMNDKLSDFENEFSETFTNFEKIGVVKNNYFYVYR